MKLYQSLILGNVDSNSNKISFVTLKYQSLILGNVDIVEDIIIDDSTDKSVSIPNIR